MDLYKKEVDIPANNIRWIFPPPWPLEIKKAFDAHPASSNR